MTIRKFLVAVLAFSLLALWGCGKSNSVPSSNSVAATTPTPADPNVPSALPDNAFKAVLTVIDPPAKLRTGQRETIQVKVKNASDVLWYARGAAVNLNADNKFYLAVGNRWLEAGSQKLVTDMDGRYGLNRDLKPGEETELPLVINAPKNAGDYVLELDLVQEQVAWFSDKGSTTARVNIKVER